MKILLIGLSENDTIRGVERYTLELARYIKIQYPGVQLSLLRAVWQDYYRELLEYEVNLVTQYELENSKVRRNFFTAFQLPRLCQGYDLVHYNNTHPIFVKNQVPTVITIHDIAEYFVPEKYSIIQRAYRKAIMKLIPSKVEHIITVSNFSKCSIINKLKVDSKRITSIYEGIEHLFKEKTKMTNLDPRLKDSDYILYWSVLEHSKGILETVKAFELIQKNYGNLKLVVIGRKGNAYAAFERLTRGSQSILYLGYVDDSALIHYIRNAKAIIFPSRYEGFGFPPLEAFVHNDNIIASSTTSVGEITADFAVQVNPASIHEIATAIAGCLDRPQHFTAEQKNVVFRKYSWKTCAEKTVGVYQDILSRNSNRHFKHQLTS